MSASALTTTPILSRQLPRRLRIATVSVYDIVSLLVSLKLVRIVACTGDANSICGGGYRLQIYASPSAPVDVATLPAGWSLTLACAVDTSDRVFADATYAQLVDNTPQRCINHCAALGFTMGGVEYSDECYCGNSFRNAKQPATVDASKCSYACKGAPDLTCGGSWSVQIYSSAS
jgi:hypothetical protein